MDGIETDSECPGNENNSTENPKVSTDREDQCDSGMQALIKF